MTGDLSGQPFNLSAYCISAAARSAPDKTALIVYDAAAPTQPVETFTFAELERSVLSIASALHSAGFQTGDRIAIHLGNSSASALLFFGAIAGGFVALPLSDQLTGRELNTLLMDSGARALATTATFEDGVIPKQAAVLTPDDIGRWLGQSPNVSFEHTKSNDPAFLIYTSGTTARPKGVLHAHRSVLGRRPMYQGWYGIDANDRMLHAGSFNWTFTLGVGLTDPWANSATAIVVTGEKRPERWPELIRESRATLFAAVPGIYRQILKYAADAGSLGALRHGLMAGETPPPGLIEEWTSTTGLPLYEALGMSEISTYISTGPSTPRRPGTVGKAQAGRTVAIIDVDGGQTPLPPDTPGLIAVHRSDPGLMLGYWNRRDEEAEVIRGQWFVGGDLGSIDADGYISHLGRANELMNAGGYRVSPQEVEAAIARCPGVAEVACTEISVRGGVALIAAFIVKSAEATIDAEIVSAFAKSHLAAYKCPREIIFVDHLPRTPNGKVQRKALGVLLPAG